jgi:hypothetical protein
MIIGRRVELRLINENEKNLPILYIWRNDLSFLEFCSVRRNIVDYETFVSELRGDFKKDRHFQRMILLKSNKKQIGTIFSYNLNLVDWNVYVTTYLDLCIVFLFNLLPLFKIYMDVYEYNQNSLVLLQRAGIHEEGRFKKHHFWKGKRYNLIRFAIYRKDLNNC